MEKCLLLGSDEVFFRYYNLIRAYERQGAFEVTGVSFTHRMDSTMFYADVLGYRNILPEELDLQPDWRIIVLADGELSGELTGMLAEVGIAENRIIPYRVLLLWDLDFGRYLALKDDPPTIFADNCLGGLLYHRLGLKFMSPFINMWMDPADYLKFLEQPREYMNREVTCLGEEYEEVQARNYPVGDLGGLRLHFNHYHSFEEAKAAWDKRRERIRWDRLLVLMHTQDRAQAEEFDALPYEKKLCFVPFRTDQGSLHYLEHCGQEHHFWDLVNSLAKENPYLDVVELLSEGRVKRMSHGDPA